MSEEIVNEPEWFEEDEDLIWLLSMWSICIILNYCQKNQIVLKFNYSHFLILN